MRMTDAVKQQYPKFDEPRLFELKKEAKELKARLAYIESEIAVQERLYFQVLGFTTGWQAKEKVIER